MEPQSLIFVAQMVMDWYYKQYRSKEDFFDIEHFKFLASAAYKSLIEEDVKEQKYLNKTMMGFSWIDISQDWLKTIDAPIEVDTKTKEIFLKLPEKIFSFQFDSLGWGVQLVEHIEPCNSCNLRRLSINDKWQLSLLPDSSNIYYIVLRDKVFLDRKVSDKEMRVSYVPDIIGDENALMAGGKIMAVVTQALQFALAARDGNFPIDKTSNQNNNAALQTEISKKSI